MQNYNYKRSNVRDNMITKKYDNEMANRINSYFNEKITIIQQEQWTKQSQKG